MTRGFKFVAVVVVLVLLTGTIAAYANCLRPEQAQMTQCPPDCPMMTHQAGDQVRGDAESGPCCQFSSEKPSPASTPQIPATGQSGIVQPKTTAATFVPRSPETRTTVVPLRVDTSPQALLCTFLI